MRRLRQVHIHEVNGSLVGRGDDGGRLTTGSKGDEESVLTNEGRNRVEISA